jgi:hypothetical protein
MARRIIFIVLILVVAGFVYLGYSTYDAKRAFGDGEVYTNDRSIGPIKSTGATMPDAKSTSSDPSASPSASAAVSPASSDAAPAVLPATGGTVTGAPATDTISPEPPNGMAFAGTGKYQFYRQGNITWRLNTSTGQTCIIFATDEEWRKPKVYRAGCGSTR